MNWSAGKIGTIFKEPAHAIGLSTPPIGCVLDLPGLPGGGNKIYDRSPYGNHGTIYGAVWKFQNGLWVLDFDGDDDSVTLNMPSAAYTTMMVWLKLGNTTQTDKAIAGNMRYTYRDSHGKGLQYSAGTLYAMGEANNDHNKLSCALNDTNWHLITGIFAVSGKLFVDEAEKATGDISSYWTYSFTIGDDHEQKGNMDLAGRIALPRIYNRALSALEIQNHYQQEKYLFGVW